MIVLFLPIGLRLTRIDGDVMYSYIFIYLFIDNIDYYIVVIWVK